MALGRLDSGKACLERAADVSYFGKSYQREASRMLSSMRIKEMWIGSWEKYALVLIVIVALGLLIPLYNFGRHVYVDCTQQINQAKTVKPVPDEFEGIVVPYNNQKNKRSESSEARREREREERLERERLRMAEE